jgi:hypothetical protein
VGRDAVKGWVGFALMVLLAVLGGLAMGVPRP